MEAAAEQGTERAHHRAARVGWAAQATRRAHRVREARRSSHRRKRTSVTSRRERLPLPRCVDRSLGHALRLRATPSLRCAIGFETRKWPGRRRRWQCPRPTYQCPNTQRSLPIHASHAQPFTVARTACVRRSYVAEPVRYLHTIDPRIKQAWLLALLLLPVRASLEVREAVDALLVLLAVTSLPYSVWKPQVRVSSVARFGLAPCLLGQWQVAQVGSGYKTAGTRDALRICLSGPPIQCGFTVRHRCTAAHATLTACPPTSARSGSSI
jgi:hypothetical protein